MRPCFGPDVPGLDVIEHVMRGEWFVPDPETPACGVVLYVPADRTTDHTERMFVCDKPEGHPAAEQHRQVTDAAEGQALEWGEQ